MTEKAKQVKAIFNDIKSWTAEAGKNFTSAL